MNYDGMGDEIAEVFAEAAGFGRRSAGALVREYGEPRPLFGAEPFTMPTEAEARAQLAHAAAERAEAYERARGEQLSAEEKRRRANAYRVRYEKQRRKEERAARVYFAQWDVGRLWAQQGRTYDPRTGRTAVRKSA